MLDLEGQLFCIEVRSFLPERTSAEGGPPRQTAAKLGRLCLVAYTQVAAGRECRPAGGTYQNSPND